MPRRLLYIGLGHVCVLCAVVGMFVPVWPTTVFLLLAAAAYARGSERFYRWLIDHPRLGPPVRDWYSHGVVRPRAKALAISMIVAGASVPVVFLGIPLVAKVGTAAICGAVILFLATRPSTPQPGSAPVGGWLGAPPQYVAEQAAKAAAEADAEGDEREAG